MNPRLFFMSRGFVCWVVLFWLGFTILGMGLSWLSADLRGKDANLVGNLIWNLGWLLWLVETFVVVAIARILPLERSRWLPRAVMHAVVGLLVAFLHIQFEAFLNDTLTEILKDQKLHESAFRALFFYRFHVVYLIYWAIVGATNAFDYYVRYHETEVKSTRLEKELVESQLQALKTQLHPHFLFNTHHSIIALMLKEENKTAVRMLTRLSELLRLTLENSERQTASLREELDALRLYIEIQTVRFDDRVRFVVDVPEELEGAEVPYLMLQPLVENSVTHGVDEGGEIRIAAQRVGSELRLMVIDSGREDEDFEIPTDSHGIGIRNTRSRLSRLYEDEGQLSLIPNADGGMVAEVKIPWKIYQGHQTEAGGHALGSPNS
jgi:two-component system LytT family sensor kinase